MDNNHEGLALLDLIRTTGMQEEEDHVNPSEANLKLRLTYKELAAQYILGDQIEPVFLAAGYERRGFSFYKRNATGSIRIIRPIHIHFVKKIDYYYMIAEFGLLDQDYYLKEGIPVVRFPLLNYFTEQIFYPTKERLKELGCSHKSARHVLSGNKTVGIINYKEWYLPNGEWLNYQAKELIVAAEEMLPFPNRLI